MTVRPAYRQEVKTLPRCFCLLHWHFWVLQISGDRTVKPVQQPAANNGDWKIWDGSRQGKGLLHQFLMQSDCNKTHFYTVEIELFLFHHWTLRLPNRQALIWHSLLKPTTAGTWCRRCQSHFVTAGKGGDWDPNHSCFTSLSGVNALKLLTILDSGSSSPGTMGVTKSPSQTLIMQLNTARRTKDHNNLDFKDISGTSKNKLCPFF